MGYDLNSELQVLNESMAKGEIRAMFHSIKGTPRGKVCRNSSCKQSMISGGPVSQNS